MKKQNGFTLIELILYIAIFSTVVSSLSIFYVQSVQNRNYNMAVNEVERQGNFALNKILREIEMSTAINTPVPGQNLATTSLSRSSATENPTTVDLNSSQIRVTNPSSTNLLTNTDVQVTSLSFSNLSNTGTKGSLRVRFVATKNNYSKEFIGTTTLK